MAEDVIGIIVTPACAVGDGIALEQDAVIGLENSAVGFGGGGGGRHSEKQGGEGKA